MKRTALLAALLTLAACDDPSNVGLGLVGGEGGVPVIERIDVPLVRTDRAEPTGNANQALAGVTTDPALGTIAASAYLDFGSPQQLNSNNSVDDFRSSTLRSVTLELPVTYRYGDTTSTVRYALRELESAFSAALAPSDTSFSAGAVITSFEAHPDSATIEVTLPDSWVARNDTVLSSTAFGAVFNGLLIEPESGDAILGFRQSGPDGLPLVALRAVAGDDTVRFVANAGVTTTERRTPPPVPDDQIVFQDGFEHTLDLTLVTDDLLERLEGGAITRTVVEIPTVGLGDDGPYARLRGASRVELVAIDSDDDDLVARGQALVGAFGELGDDGVLRFTTPRLQQFVQQAVLGDPACFDADETDCFGRLALRFTAGDNTLAPYLLTGEARVAVTFIPSDS